MPIYLCYNVIYLGKRVNDREDKNNLEIADPQNEEEAQLL